MLNRLLEVSDGAAKPGFRTKAVRWLITCNETGGYTGIIPAGVDQYGALMVCPDSGSQAQSSTGAHFLCDKLEIVALFGKDGDNSGKHKKNQSFCDFIREAAVSIAYLKCAYDLLTDSEELTKIREELKVLGAKNSDVASIRIGSKNPIDDSDVIDWWSNRRIVQIKTSEKMRCFATGGLVTPMEIHPKIGGLKKYGGRGQDNLVSFYAPSFTSYGLKESSNACMAESTATSYAETLNNLIKEQSVTLGGSLCTYWFSHSVQDEEDSFSFLQNPETPEPGVDSLPRKLLNSIQSGDRTDLVNNHYYALTLSGASGRVMVRDWMEGQFPELLQHIDQWFDDLAIVARDGKRLAPFPKFLAVAGSTERDLGDVPPPLMLQLYKTAMGGLVIPQSAKAKALLRTRTHIIQDEPISHAGMGLIKAHQIRNKGDQHMGTHLNPDHPEAAYQCGRLLAILARLQRSALGDVGAGVVQRYYSAASQTPALTIGRLMSNAKNHLSKLDGGLQHWYENQIADVMACIDSSIPKTLDLEKQSLFALGYYQQIAKLNAGKDKTSDDQGDES